MEDSPRRAAGNVLAISVQHLFCLGYPLKKNSGIIGNRRASVKSINVIQVTTENKPMKFQENVSRENTLGGVDIIMSAQFVVYSSSTLPGDSAGDQSVKKKAARCRKAPSKVNMAIGTNSNTPHVTGKPGEFGRGGSDIATAPGIPVTDNFKNNSFGIGKRVPEITIDNFTFRVRRNHVEALATYN